MTTRLTSIVLLALALTGSLARAQEVTGTVRDEARQTPLAGAVVVLTASAGSRLSATLTDDAGRFRLRAPSAGTYGIRVDVIGYRSVHVAPFQVEAAATVTSRHPVSVSCDRNSRPSR